jgi:hypothetical protein
VPKLLENLLANRIFTMSEADFELTKKAPDDNAKDADNLKSQTTAGGKSGEAGSEEVADTSGNG